MFRMFMGLLIVAVIFLAGMVVGISKEEPASSDDSSKLVDFHPVSHDKHEETPQHESQNDYNETKDDMADNDEPAHLTQKIAASLESVVKGFYEGVVQLCYAFANLFF